jgi:hypothetical protein
MRDAPAGNSVDPRERSVFLLAMLLGWCMESVAGAVLGAKETVRPAV